MRLESVAELKAALQARVARTPAALRTFTVRAGLPRGPQPDSRPKPLFSLGAAPRSNKPDDFKLAVRMYKGHQREAMALIGDTLEKHEGEIDLATGLKYTPRVTLRAGGSCGHYNITAGTLGAFVEDDKQYYMLSNNHVLADSDEGEVGDPVLVPGPADIVNGRHIVAGFLDRWIPLGLNKVDAAIASFSEDISAFYHLHYTGIGDIVPRPISNRHHVRNVIKRGITTKVTLGTVSAFDLDEVAINYGTERKPWIVTFDNQIEIIGAPPTRPFSQPGDSGSLIIDRDTMRPYALLYGGGPDDQGIDRTLANFIPEVLDLLQVRFVR